VRRGSDPCQGPQARWWRISPTAAASFAGVKSKPDTDTPKWRHHARLKVIDVMAQTEELLREARGVIDEENDGNGIF